MQPFFSRGLACVKDSYIWALSLSDLSCHLEIFCLNLSLSQDFARVSRAHLHSNMALVTVSHPIPGFHCQPTIADLEDSTHAYVKSCCQYDQIGSLMAHRYNTLTNSEELSSEILHLHLQDLAQIFVKYSVHDRLGVHLIHSHTEVAIGYVMLG